MKFRIHFLLNLILMIPLICAEATPKFISGNKYAITNYTSPKNGGIVPNYSGDFQVSYNYSASASNKYWIVTEEQSGKFSFKNATTGQYIQYVSPNARNGLSLSSTLKTDQSTLFTCEYINNNFFAICPVNASAQAFYQSTKSPEFPIGTGGRDDNNSTRFFMFLDEKGNVITDESTEDNNNSTLKTGPIFNFLNSFTLNEKSLVYRTSPSSYYFSIPYNKMESSAQYYVNFTKKNPNYSVYINNVEVKNDESFIFKNISATTAFTISVKNGNNTLVATSLYLTGLPIVQIFSNSYLNSSYYSPGEIVVSDPSSLLPNELLNASFRIRGATASGKPKKSYAIKLKDETRQNTVDRSYFGLREDNNWILDAMYIDPGRIRNRVATDLWNDFSSRPYFADREPENINATRGQYVEVFYNNDYNGLYCMTEKVDRKQLKLKKYQSESENIRGVLYKSANWSFSVFLGHEAGKDPTYSQYAPSFNNYSESWDGYEVKYPDLGDGEKVDWRPLYDLVNFVAVSSSSDFKNNIADRVDLPLFIDYYLFMELILATDNHGKNLYLYQYDKNTESKFCIAPWDLDGSWGRRWEGSTVAAKQDYTDFIKKNEHGEYTIYTRLKSLNAESFNEKIRQRWRDLVDSHFNAENINNRFIKYFELFSKSGAATREQQKWGVLPTNDLNYTTEWVKNRVSYLTDIYGRNLPTPKITLNCPNQKTYGDEPFQISASSTSSVNKVEISCNPVGIVNIDENNIVKIIRSGFVEITATQAANSSYNKASSTIKLEIAKKALIVVADSYSRPIGSENPLFTYHYEGLVNDDNPNLVVLIKPKTACDADITSPTGSYPIKVSGGVAGYSYVIGGYVEGSLTITDTNQDILLGDSNQDGVINISDIVSIVNNIVENVTENFSKIHSDVNKDDYVNIADVVGVINLILKNSYSSRAISNLIYEGTIQIDNKDIILNTDVAVKGFDFSYEGEIEPLESLHDFVITKYQTALEKRVIAYSINSQIPPGDSRLFRFTGNKVSDPIFIAENGSELLMNQSIITKSATIDNSKIRVSLLSGILNVESEEEISSVEVFNPSGQKLLSSTEKIINVLPLNQPILIIKVMTFSNESKIVKLGK